MRPLSEQLLHSTLDPDPQPPPRPSITNFHLIKPQTEQCWIGIGWGRSPTRFWLSELDAFLKLERWNLDDGGGTSARWSHRRVEATRQTFVACAGVWATPCYTWRQNVGYLLRYSTSETAAIKLGFAKTAKPDQKCVPGVCRLATSRSNFRVVLFS